MTTAVDDEDDEDDEVRLKSPKMISEQIWIPAAFVKPCMVAPDSIMIHEAWTSIIRSTTGTASIDPGF